MATAALTNTPTVIDNAEAVTNWGGDSFSLDPDILVQGSNSVSCIQSVNGNNDLYVTGSWDFSGTGSGDQHLRLWFNCGYVGNLSSTNPIQVFLYDGTNTAYYYWDKASSYSGGWNQAVIYTGDTPDSGSVTKSSITRIGIRFVTSTKPSNKTNMWCDAWTYGDGYTVTGGTSGDPIDWSHIAATDATSAYGIVREIDGVFFLRGDIQIGDGTSTTYFEPSGQLAMFTDEQVLSTLYNITFTDDASLLTNIDIQGGALSCAGTTLRYDFTASDADVNSLTIDGLQFSRMDNATFAADTTHTITNCVFNDCNQVDPSTSTFTDCTFSNSTATDGACLFPANDANWTGHTFINCDNGVEYDAASDSTSPEFDGFTFDDEAGNYDVNNTSGAAVSISNVNGSNANSYNTGGDTVTFISNPVTSSIHVQDSDTAADISGARVLVEVTSSANYPYQASVTITRSVSTATVAHTAHGLATDDFVVIDGADQQEYNSVHQITVTGVDAYTYTVSGTPTTPATGTIVSTYAPVSGTTDVNGDISDSKAFSVDQPIQGWVRKASTGTLYKPATFTGTIDKDSGFTTTVALIPDE